MDDRYREGFERLLSDMDDAPSWEQVSVQRVAVPPVRSRSQGLLVAAAAFAVTIIAIGTVVFAFRGDGVPVATPAETTIDHIEIAWVHNVDLQCNGMNPIDNDGFGDAKIDIWGPNAEGLVRIDATAPDGTVERVITSHPRDYEAGLRVWSSYEKGSSEQQTVFRVAECVKGSSSYRVSDPPVSEHGHAFGAFISISTELPNGTPFDLLADQPPGAVISDDTWRGTPVKVIKRSGSDTGDLGAYANAQETWFDPVSRRFERVVYLTSDETLGTAATTIEVVERGTVPVDSVSFSTDDLNLTRDTPSATGSDDSPDDTTTTTTLAPSPTDSRWIDQQLSDAANIWVNQIGLNQSDPDVWRSRLGRICDIGPATGDADTAMNMLAAEFIAEDAALSVRADGDLPTSAEAVESLWTIAISPVCLETSLTGTTVPDVVNVADFDDVDSVDAEINRRHALIDEIMAKRDDAERKIRNNQEILAALEAQTNPPASQQVIERQRVIIRVAELEREQAEETLTRIEAIMADLQARHAELVDIVEAHMAEDRAAAQDRATQHAPYLVEDPIGLEPPSALPGKGGASGSGCYPGPGDLPDGIWFGYLLDRDGPTIDFDLDCMYYGEAARAFAGESDTDADDDIVFVKFDAVVRTLPVAATATVWMITGDATEGHQALSFDREWTGDESTYASCPGEGCPIWIYVNDGIVDAIVQQYLP